MRLIKVTLLVAGVLAGAAVRDAHADVYTYGSYGFVGGTITVNDPSLGIDNEYGGTGMTILNGTPTINAYCVDIYDWLLPSGSFNTGVDPATDPNLIGKSSITGDSKIADIASLIFNGTDPGAIQMAIWETEYGSGATFTPDDPTIQADASAYLSDVASIWTVPSNYSLYELTPADGQTNQAMVYLIDPPDQVPEPGTFPLLGGAVLLTGVFAKRRRGALGR